MSHPSGRPIGCRQRMMTDKSDHDTFRRAILLLYLYVVSQAMASFVCLRKLRILIVTVPFLDFHGRAWCCSFTRLFRKITRRFLFSFGIPWTQSKRTTPTSSPIHHVCTRCRNKKFYVFGGPENIELRYNLIKNGLIVGGDNGADQGVYGISLILSHFYVLLIVMKWFHTELEARENKTLVTIMKVGPNIRPQS